MKETEDDNGLLSSNSITSQSTTSSQTISSQSRDRTRKIKRHHEKKIKNETYEKTLKESLGEHYLPPFQDETPEQLQKRHQKLKRRLQQRENVKETKQKQLEEQCLKAKCEAYGVLYFNRKKESTAQRSIRIKELKNRIYEIQASKAAKLRQKQNEEKILRNKCEGLEIRYYIDANELDAETAS